MGKFLNFFKKINIKIRKPVFGVRKKGYVPPCRFVKKRNIDFRRSEKNIRINEI
jgi:hypothetical protein